MTAPTPEDWLRLSWHREDTIDVEGAMRAATTGLAVAKRIDAPAAVLDLTCQIARIYRRWHDVEQPLQTLSAAEPWARRCRDKGSVARYYALYAFYLGEKDELEKAMSMSRKALGLARRCGPDTLYIVLSNFGEQSLRIGRFDEAIDILTEALQTTQQLPPGPNTDYRFCYARAILATALCDRAETVRPRTAATGEDALAEADRLAVEALRHSEARVPILTAMALIVLGRCRALAAVADPETRRRVLATPPPDVWIAPGRTHWAALAWARFEAEVNGDPTFAKSLLDLMKSPDEGNRWIDWMPEWHTTSAVIHQLAGRFEAACASLQAALQAERQSRARHTAALLDLFDRVQADEKNRQRERAVARREARLRIRNEKLSAERQRLTQDAMTDPLTQIGNRRLLEQTVETLEQRSRRGNVTIAILDIDHFKSINDRFSHPIGDRVIATVARLLTEFSRASDLCVRWGGEEFLILYRGLVNQKRLDSLLRGIEAHSWVEIAEGLTVTASLGAATWAPGEPFQTALTLADKRLYTAKFLGRNRSILA